jgi:hypothetical protein
VRLLTLFASSVLSFAVAACGIGVGRTFEPGVEHVPGPGIFLIRVVPADAIDTRQIKFTAYGDETVLSQSRRGDERFLSGLDLPSTLRVLVDGRVCAGSIDMVSDMEYDGTLTIGDATCELRLDLAHRAGTIDHALEDDGPIAS